MSQFTGIVHLFSVGRAGTTLVSGLFDGHPQLIGFPEEFALVTDWWEDEMEHIPPLALIDRFLLDHQPLFKNGPFDDLSRDDQELVFREFVDTKWHMSHVIQFDEQIQSVDPLRFPRLPHGEFRSLLVERFAGSGAVSLSKFLESIHAALVVVRGTTNPPGSLWIVADTHLQTPNHIRRIRQLGTRQVAIHMLREPFPTTHTYFAPGLYPHLEASFRTLLPSIRRDSRHQLDLFEWSLAIRIEDLHRDPRGVLSALCDRLGIEWNDSLLQPTFFGVPWTWAADPPDTPTFHLPRLRRYEELQATHLGARCAAHTLTDLYDRWNYPRPKHPFGLSHAIRYALGIGPDVGDAPLRTRIGMILELIRNRIKHRPRHAVPLTKLPQGIETFDPYR